MTFTKEERERNKSLLLATLNYLVAYHSGDMVFDGYSPSNQWYLNEIKQSEKDIKAYRSKQIKRRLAMHISLLKQKFDLGINGYLKAQTGYDIDIYEDYKTDVAPIISEKSLSYNNVYLVERYLKAYAANPEEQEHVGILTALLEKHEIEKQRRLMGADSVITQSMCFVQQGKTSQLMSLAEAESLSNKWVLYEKVSPNGVNKLVVKISGTGQHALTYVNIELPGGSGLIYGAKGEKLPLKVYWKDNNHIVIETKREYEHPFKYHQISNYGELFDTEYHYD